jgi:predicted DNA-binding ribbon-helix-helix protein
MGKPQKTTSINKHSVIVAGHKTSVSLEDAFWHRLQDIAGGQGLTVSKLVQRVEHELHDGNLSSAVRVFVLDHFCTQKSERTHAAGNGDATVSMAISPLTAVSKARL